LEKDRLIEIETKLAFQEKIIKDLNDVVLGQEQTIETLEKRYQKLAGLLDDLMKDAGAGPANDPPPHY